MKEKKYPGKALGAILIVLLLMPLGHALMILMEHFLTPTALHYSAFAMGFMGLVKMIWGVLSWATPGRPASDLRGHCSSGQAGWSFSLPITLSAMVSTAIRQWHETISQYVDGVAVHHTFTINGTPLEDFSRAELKEIRGSRPEYLIMPATFGMWMMIVLLYVFCTRSGCLFIQWVQNHCGLKNRVELRPMAHHASIVMFMEWNVMMWGLYLLLMFCYDPVFLGDHHPVTCIIAVVCLIGSALMFKRQLRIGRWGRSLRMAYAIVIVFWSFVEIAGRNGFFKEIWVDPLHHVVEMVAILVVFILLVVGYWLYNARESQQ